jgi:glucose dehydrogenase
MATGGDLLFQGGPNEGVFRAFDARNGEILWSFRTGSGFAASPITYIGPDGRQYVAVIGSGATSAQVTHGEPETARSRFSRGGTALYVFALPAGQVNSSR